MSLSGRTPSRKALHRKALHRKTPKITLAASVHQLKVSGAAARQAAQPVTASGSPQQIAEETLGSTAGHRRSSAA